MYPVSKHRQTTTTWYSENPVGVNTLKATVKRLAKEAKLEGHFTNHSLRLTAATRLYQAGVDEQTIMEYTGHKSEAVRLYKRPSDKIMEAANFAVCEGVTPDLKPRPAFNIDSVKLDTETVQYTPNLDAPA